MSMAIYRDFVLDEKTNTVTSPYNFGRIKMDKPYPIEKIFEYIDELLETVCDLRAKNGELTVDIDNLKSEIRTLKDESKQIENLAEFQCEECPHRVSPYSVIGMSRKEFL